MLKKFLLLGLVAVLAALSSASTARADTITFNLTENTCSGGCGSGPFGTVTITSDGQPADTVLVTETLTGADGFVSTGAGYALAFSVDGNPTLTIGSLSSGFSVGNALAGQTESRDGAGTYMYWIVCDDCGSGGSNPLPGPLSFTVSAAGITPGSFDVTNDKGYYLASDVLAGGNTGNVEAIGEPGDHTTSVPEPGTFGLLATALLGLTFVSRRRLLFNS